MMRTVFYFFSTTKTHAAKADENINVQCYEEFTTLIVPDRIYISDTVRTRNDPCMRVYAPVGLFENFGQEISQSALPPNDATSCFDLIVQTNLSSRNTCSHYRVGSSRLVHT